VLALRVLVREKKRAMLSGEGKNIRGRGDRAFVDLGLEFYNISSSEMN
jgi:hypothetical protein